MAGRVTGSVELTELTVTRSSGRSASTRADASAPRRAGSGAGLLFGRLARASGRGIAGALEPLGLRPQEFGALHYLARYGPLPQGALGAALRIDPSNLVSLIDGLEDGRLLLRGRDPSDRRRHLIALTERGAERLAAADRAVAEAEKALLDPLSAAERRQLVSLLERLAAHSCSHRGSGCF